MLPITSRNRDRYGTRVPLQRHLRAQDLPYLRVGEPAWSPFASRAHCPVGINPERSTDYIKTLERRIASLFRLDDETWRRHANPWSVVLRNTALPLLILAFWCRLWLG